MQFVKGKKWPICCLFQSLWAQWERPRCFLFLFFFYQLWKIAGKGGDKWYSSLGPREAAVFNRHIYTQETRQGNMHPSTKTHITHTFPSFVVSAAKWLFIFHSGCFYLCFVLKSLMKGSVWGRGSSHWHTVLHFRGTSKNHWCFLILVNMKVQSKVEAPLNERRHSELNITKNKSINQLSKANLVSN